ncbi:hypothetical protein JY425_21555, partial [Stenotrophomonas maltophilia]|nr:hypothetical protein [Stenotrophomonas maltophilia]
MAASGIRRNLPFRWTAWGHPALVGADLLPWWVSTLVDTLFDPTALPASDRHYPYHGNFAITKICI